MDNLFKLKSPLKIYIPVINVKFKFSLKETAKLSSIYIIFLSAISNYNASIDLLSDFTMFEKSVIECELHNMYKQQLLEMDENGNYKLTQLSRRLLKYTEWTEKMNEMNTRFTLNMVTGTIQIEKGNEKSNVGADEVKANKIMSKFAIDTIDAMEIKETLISAYPFLLNVENAEVDDFIENIIVESSCEKEEKWKLMYITHLPLGYFQTEQEHINIKCSVVQKEYEIYDEYIENNIRIISEMKNVHNFDSSLLSKKGIELLERYNLYCKAKADNIRFYINSIDKSVHDGVFSVPKSKKVMKTAFNIQDYDCSEVDERLINDSLAGYDTNGFEVKEVMNSVITYNAVLPVDCIVEEVKEND